MCRVLQMTAVLATIGAAVVLTSCLGPAAPSKSGAATPRSTTSDASPPAPVELSVAEERIIKLLDDAHAFDGEAKTLVELVEHLRDVCKLPATIDRAALDEAKFDFATQISIPTDDLPLADKLRHGLRRHGLALGVTDETLCITSLERAGALLIRRCYPVGDLIYRTPEDQNEHEADFDSLIEAITRTLVPTSWDAVGGIGTIQGFREVLVVRQTHDVHRQITALLASLRKATSLSPVKPGGPIAAGMPREEALLAALNQVVELPAGKLPLPQFAASLSSSLRVSVHIDAESLADEEKDSDVDVTIDGMPTTAAAALSRALRPIGLAYGIRDGVLLITTEETGNALCCHRVYAVRDLTQRWGRKHAAQVPFVTSVGQLRALGMLATSIIPVITDGGPFIPYENGKVVLEHDDFAEIDVDPCIELLSNSVRPESWETVGGPGTICEFESGELLVISQTAQGHLEIERLLATLRRAREQEVAPQRPILSWEDRLKARKKRDQEYVLMSANLREPKGENACPPSEKDLVETIKKLVEPDSWTTDKRAYIGALPGRIVVRHRREVVREIDHLLEDLGELSHWQPIVKLWPSTPRQSHLIIRQYCKPLERNKGLALIPSWSTKSHGGFYDVGASGCRIHAV